MTLRRTSKINTLVLKQQTSFFHVHFNHLQIIKVKTKSNHSICPLLVHISVMFVCAYCNLSPPSQTLCSYIVHNSGNLRWLMSLLTLSKQLLLILVVRFDINQGPTAKTHSRLQYRWFLPCLHSAV